MDKNKKPNLSNINLNIITGVLVLLVNIFFCFIMWNITSFANLSKVVFIVVNIVIILLVLGLNLTFIIGLKPKKKKLLKNVLLIAIVFSLLSGYGTFAIFKVNRNVNKIITSNSVQETVETSIVVNKGTLSDLSGLDGKEVGIVTGTKNAELGKSHIDSEKVDVTYVEFSDINTLFTSLVGNEVDAAVLPSNYKGIFEVVDGYEDALKNTEAIDTFSDKVTSEISGSTKDITSEPISILVLGVDEGRSDANMVVTFNPISLEITMTSLARDSYVPIACYAGQSSDKLGHARVQGVECTIKTIENLLDIDIDYYFESNFKGVVEMVDALGGIVINNPYEIVGQDSSDERGHYTVWVPPGENVPVNGEQALAFARERHLYATGDFQRQANQQQVIKAVLTKAMQTRDLNKLLNMLDAAGDNVKTNISIDEFIDLFNYIMEKTKRYQGIESLENMFKIVGSRVTGYNSSVWSEAAQLALSIVRPYEGSIKDNNEGINRNLNLDSTISAPKEFYWRANSEFKAPTISNETYSEQIIQAETPQSYWCTKSGGTWDGGACACPVGEFVENKGCVEDSATNYADPGSCNAAGFIWDNGSNSCVNSCPEGTISDGKACQVAKKEAGAYTVKEECIANGYKWDNGCLASCPSGKVDNDGNGECEVVPSPEASTKPTPVPGDYKDQTGCTGAGFKWDTTTNSCVASCPSGTEDKGGVCQKPIQPTTQPTAPSHTHEYKEVILQEATCDAPGRAIKQCSCGAKDGAEYEIPKLTGDSCHKHSFVDTILVKPTCDAPGKGGKQCGCGVIEEGSEYEIPKLTEGCTTPPQTQTCPEGNTLDPATNQCVPNPGGGTGGNEGGGSTDQGGGTGGEIVPPQEGQPQGDSATPENDGAETVAFRNLGNYRPLAVRSVFKSLVNLIK